MTDENTNESTEKVDEPLDLGALSSIDFGPSWAGGDKNASSRNQQKKYKGEQKGRQEKRGASSSRDRRPARTVRSKDVKVGEHRAFRKNGSGNRKNNELGQSNFEPTVKIDLYPQDEAFDALVKRLQSTARTYQLFEITKLLLEKYERFIVVVSPKSKGEATKKLYYSVPGHLPFETEDAAVNHVLANHLDLFFTTETVEVEPPKGNFQMVNRCPLTQVLLGPPNYHRYSEFLNRHFVNRISGMSMERYLEKIETIKEQEVIDAWVDSMKESVRYTVKDPVEGEPTVLETVEAARLFLLQYRKAAVVGSGESVRFAGRDLKHLPVNDIRRSVESFVEQQRHFPLETANNIRGRLRRHNFTIYKKGAKNASYVCAVKRKFRDSDTVFTESIQGLISFIEQNPEVKASHLALSYMGIKIPKKQPSHLNLAEQDIAGSQEDAEVTTGSHSTETDSSGETENTTTVEATSEKEADDSEAKPDVVLSEEQALQLKQLRIDLRWLITEGYVTEYGDGRLFAPLPTLSKNKEAKADTSTELKETQIEETAAKSLVDTAKSASSSIEGNKPSETPDDAPVAVAPVREELAGAENPEQPQEVIQAPEAAKSLAGSKLINSADSKE